MYNKQQKNQVPNQKNLKDLNEIKQLKTGRILETINLVVNQCLYYNNNYYESEATIAKRLGIGTRTVCRAIKKARELGLISRKRRINNSNIYGLNPELRRPEIIDELAAILPALRGLLCLSFLIPIVALCNSASRQSMPDTGAQYKKEVIINASALSLYRETTKKYGLVSTPVWHPEGTAQNRASIKEHPDPERILKQEGLSQDSIESAVQFLAQMKTRTTSRYVNEQTAREFKEFCDQRLSRLIESIGKLALAPDKKAEIIERQLQSYKDRLHFKDCIALRQEGYPT
ncbi:MAG: hypothetical protein ABSB40_12195 [Nitrososphaeria archaeon]|jgi:DNA-binding Lrp family transcriptional regulator